MIAFDYAKRNNADYNFGYAEKRNNNSASYSADEHA